MKALLAAVCVWLALSVALGLGACAAGQVSPAAGPAAAGGVASQAASADSAQVEPAGASSAAVGAGGSSGATGASAGSGASADSNALSPSASSAASGPSASTSASAPGGAHTSDDGFVDIADIVATAQGPSGAASAEAQLERMRRELGIEDMTDEYREMFEHGEKGAEFQKYIVLHDTEGDGEPADIVHSWGGGGVAAHFVVGRDGSIAQCVDMDVIAHHAGFGDTGHNGLYGVEDESRDDRAGTEPIGEWAADYGMNSYSIGIEMVHVSGEGDYPEEQLRAVDGLIAYIDAYYGKESGIIDHKAWRTGNSDTSAEFAEYLRNYQEHRTHGS